MPIIDNAGQTTVGTSTSPLTISSFAVGSGSNRLLVVGVSYYTGAGNPSLTVSSVVFNTTTNLVFLDSKRQVAFSGQEACEFWYFVNPPNVTGDIVVTFTSAPNESIAGACSYIDVHQTRTFGVVAKNADTGASLGTITVASETNSIVQDLFEGGDLGAPVATGTQLWNVANASGHSRALSQYKAGAASVVMNWTTTQMNQWVAMAVSIHDIDFPVLAAVAGQATGERDNGVNSFANLAFPFNVTAGNQIVVAYNAFRSGSAPVMNTPTYVSGTASIGSFVLDGSYSNNSSTNYLGAAIYRARVTSSGSLTLGFSGTFAGAQVGINEYVGMAANPVDGPPATNSSTSATESTGSMATSGPGMITMTSDELSSTNFTYTLSDTQIWAESLSAVHTGEVQYKLTSTSGTYTLTADTGNSWFWIALGVAYKAEQAPSTSFNAPATVYTTDHWLGGDQY